MGNDRPDDPRGATQENRSKSTGAQYHHPNVCANEGPRAHSRPDQGPARRDRPMGREFAKPVPHYLEERAYASGGRVSGGQLHRAAALPHGRTCAYHLPGGQVVSHRCSQGRRDLWLPGAEAGYWPVRSHYPESGLALHRQLLPGRGLQLNPTGLRFDRHSARGDEPRTL